jgi:hypothetical protein
MSLPKIIGARRMAKRKFYSEDPKVVGPTIQKLITLALWFPKFAHPV